MYSAELDFHHNHLYFSKLHHPLQSQGIYLGSCNGVVCISNTSKNDVVLFNPLTKSHLKLPVPSNRIPKLEHDVVLYGFGYDSKTDDYKVLKIVQGVRDNLFLYNKAEVFSVNIHQWKSLNSEFFMGSLVSLEDKLHPMKGSLPMKNRNRKNSDKFLSVGFKLKL